MLGLELLIIVLLVDLDWVVICVLVLCWDVNGIMDEFVVIGVKVILVLDIRFC